MSHHVLREKFTSQSPYLFGLFWVAAFLLGLGLVQVYSASFIFAIESYDDGLFFVKKQALFVVVGFLILLTVAAIPWRWAERVAFSLWIFSIIAMVLTLVPGFGVKVGGATRWLALTDGFRFEPSEIFKYSSPVYLAYLLTEGHRIKNILLKCVGWAFFFLPLFIFLKQPDFGSFAIAITTLFLILFARGLRWGYVVAVTSAMAVAFYVLVMQVPYRRARVEAFLDPWSDPAQKGFQVIQSMLGFHSGGLTGVGLGQGQGKLFFLPEAHTDFTLSVLGEELGFLGIICVLILFGFIVFRGMQIAARARDEKKQIMALGITVVFAITVLVNAGVTMGLLPTKGLGMPFLSYGGSALLSTCFGLGLLLNADRRVGDSTKRSYIKI